MTYAEPSERPAPFSLAAMRAASPQMWHTGIAFVVLFAACLLLMMFDTRLFNGVSVWTKPAKFFISSALHLFTLTAGLLLLPEQERRRPVTRGAALAATILLILELAYITFRGARGEASHFSHANLLSEVLYSLMGVAAVTIMLATAVIGLQILRRAPASLLSRAVGWSFIIAAPLTIITAATLGAMESHWVGGDQTDATGLPLFGWSTTGGDLRVSHFFALHIMQIVPAAALTGSRSLTWLAVLVTIAATGVTYFMALGGIPLLRM